MSLKAMECDAIGNNESSLHMADHGLGPHVKVTAPTTDATPRAAESSPIDQAFGCNVNSKVGFPEFLWFQFFIDKKSNVI